jgi:hypothetical protein
MGAHNFSHTYMGKATPREAHSDLVEEALYESGHDPYNGTISTTEGCTDLTNKAPRYGTKAFDKFEDKVLNNGSEYGVEKWQNCGVVEISKNTKLFKDMKARRGLQGRKGIRAYYFFGWAAS